MKGAFVAFVLASCLCSARTFAQGLSGFEASRTLREALVRGGFEDAIRTGRGADLDRGLTSSAFAKSATVFVAGYYFEDELDQQRRLGRLHVSLYDRRRNRWVHNDDVIAEAGRRGLDVGGSVLDVVISEKVVLLDTHATPSAGQTLVMDRSLHLLSSLSGFHARPTSDGSIWYFGNMTHFADTHQETLKFFDLKRHAESEIFPGSALSAVATSYEQQIKAIFASYPEFQTASTFDRTITSVMERDARLSFLVQYGSNYLENKRVTAPTFVTIARCDRRRDSSKWSCAESELETFARQVGVTPSKDRNGRYDTRTVEALIRNALDR